MFVADLDRPWIDTPVRPPGFPDHRSPPDRRTAAASAQWVVVDRARSTGPEFRKPDVETRGPSAPASRVTPHQFGDDASSRRRRPPGRTCRNVEAPRPRSRRPRAAGWRGIMDSLRGLLRRPEKGLPADPSEMPPDAQRASLLPPSTPVTIYPDSRTVEEEIAPARTAYDRNSEVLRKLASDVWAGHPVEIARVEEVVDEMVESMVRNPDALMWVARPSRAGHHDLRPRAAGGRLSRRLRPPPGLPAGRARPAGHHRAAPRHRQDQAAARASREAAAASRRRSSRP
ncbi:MAG: hypothetical protein MZW92_14105 [Comamonadaceae bacterium]|nr:hypothetical protein [Comamonadaceae bacterium]